MSRDWPDGRGIWQNDAKTIVVWINRNDHARIISMQKGGNIQQVYSRLTKGLKAVSFFEALNFLKLFESTRLNHFMF